MRKLTIIIGLVACLAFGAQAATAASQDKWSSFGNSTLSCGISKPGGARSAYCLITDGTYENWSVSAGVWGIEVRNADDGLVWQKKVFTDSPSPDISWAGWPYRNAGVACRIASLTAACIIRRGGMTSWAFIVQSEHVQVMNARGHVAFKRSTLGG